MILFYLALVCIVDVLIYHLLAWFIGDKRKRRNYPKAGPPQKHHNHLFK